MKFIKKPWISSMGWLVLFSLLFIGAFRGHYFPDFICKGPYVDVRAYASINAAVTDIGVTEKTLLIPSNQALTAALVTPTTLHLQFLKSGKITCGDHNLTINGPMSGPLSQRFDDSGAGSVSFGLGYIEKWHPEWWGAIADDSTDSYSALVSCLAAIHSATKGIMVLSNGIYLTSGGLEIEENISIEGQGRNASMIEAIAGCTGSILKLLTNTPVPQYSHFRDFAIFGNNIAARGFELEQPSIVTIENMGFGYCTTSGLDIDRGSQVWISDSYFGSGNGTGLIVTADGASNSLFIHDCTFMENTADGMYAQSLVDSWIHHNWFITQPGYGLRVTGSCERNTIDHNEAVDNEESGFRINSSNSNISHNLAYQNGKHGFYLDGVNDSVIEGNRAIENSVAAAGSYSGFRIYSTTETVFNNNKAKGSANQAYGLQVSNNTSIIAKGNELANNKTGNINVGAGCIIYPFVSNSDVATSGTGEDDLKTSTILANTLGHQGELKIMAVGTKTNANDDKTIKLHFGASSWTVHAAVNNVLDWTLKATISNTATNAQRIEWECVQSDSADPANTLVLQGYDTAAIDTTANVTLKLTGECAHASDIITQTMWNVERI